jgi:hypothetical protein
MWRDSFSARQNRKADEEPFPPDPINGMRVHHHLAYETVGCAPAYVTPGSLVNSVKGDSYTLSIEVAKPKVELER